MREETESAAQGESLFAGDPRGTAARGAHAAGDAGRVRGPGAPAGAGQAAARGDRARGAGLDDLLGPARAAARPRWPTWWPAPRARVFVPFSAVTEGVPRIREIVAEARARLESGGAQTILFIDEIHRLNKAQQDSLLPPSEDGTITLIGATTENPSFEINGALLSRTRVFVLQPLAAGAHRAGCSRRALRRRERGLGQMRSRRWTPDALRSIAVEADGDARRALTVLEAAAAHVGEGGRHRRSRWRARRCRSGSPATTRRARSTSTCSPPTTSRSGAATRRGRSTGWRGCSTAARTR